MKLAREYLRTAILSLEFLLLAICAYLAFFQPSWLSYISQIVKKDSDQLKWLVLAPLGVLIWTLTLVRKIRFPEKDKLTIIQRWPEYWRLCVVTNVAIFYAAMFTCLGLIPWLIRGAQEHHYCGVVLATALIGSVIVGASCYLAEIAVNEAMAEVTPRKRTDS